MSSKSLLLHSYTECFTQNDLYLIEIMMKHRHSGDTLPMTLKFVIETISHFIFNTITLHTNKKFRQSKTMVVHRTND